VDGDREQLGWLGLTLVRGLEAGRAAALARTLGGPSRVLGAPAAVLEDHGVSPALAAEIGRAGDRVAGELRAIAGAGATLVTLDDPAYPPLLRQIADPPLVLTIRGRVASLAEPAVAVVGARRASEYGLRVAEELAGGLALAGVTVVSGLATGIDGAAHRTALDRGGRTVAIMGTGIDAVYPAWHRGLAAEIVGEGALVSEFPRAVRFLNAPGSPVGFLSDEEVKARAAAEAAETPEERAAAEAPETEDQRAQEAADAAEATGTDEPQAGSAAGAAEPSEAGETRSS